MQDSDSSLPVVCHYLECLPAELRGIAWCPCGSSALCNIETQDGVGAGKLNTSRIVKAVHSGGPCTSLNCAAYACSRYFTETTTPGDWYLPSKEELELIYTNLIKTRIIMDKAPERTVSPETEKSTQKKKRYHWCSSQEGQSYAYVQDCSDGSSGYDFKFSRHCVWVVRAF